MSFSEFVKQKSIGEETLLWRSAQLETHRVEDRKLRLAREELRRSGNRAYAEANLAKPRSGRGLSRTQLAAALAGRPLPQRVRAKVVRAINDLLAGRSEQPVDGRGLFADVLQSTRKSKRDGETA